jgi:Na+/melibiose symporter-like transporter
MAKTGAAGGPSTDERNYMKVSTLDDNVVSDSIAKQATASSRKELTLNPKDEPTNLWHRYNFAIAMTYLSVGIADSFITTPLNVYMVETLNAQPKMQSVIGILQTLPWSMKLFFGFLSDTCPINGMHRKPYLTIGSLLYSLPYMLYALFGQHDVILLAISVFIAMLGLIQTDVMADTMCVERSKFESEEERGQMQATCYSIRFAGGIIGSIAGACVYNQAQWGWGLTFFQISFINGLLPFVMIMPGLLL